MSKKYNVFIYDSTTYQEIEADSEEEAREIALEWWNERMPFITCFHSEEKEEYGKPYSSNLYVKRITCENQLFIYT